MFVFNAYFVPSGMFYALSICRRARNKSALSRLVCMKKLFLCSETTAAAPSELLNWPLSKLL